MALFKISKGKSANLANKKPTEGYCWFTTDDGKFYVDIANGDEAVIGNNRVCLNAGKADSLSTSRKINGVNFNGSADITNYGVCSTAAATAAKTVDIPGFNLTTGAQVKVYFQYANSAASPTLNVNGTGAKGIYQYGSTAAGTSTSTTGWQAGSVVSFTYTGDRWVRDYWANNTYTVPTPICWTAAGEPEKKISMPYFSPSTNHYFQICMATSNTYKDTIVLTINGTLNCSIFINGEVSSPDNYTLPAGLYFVWCVFDQSNNIGQVYFDTRGYIPGIANMAMTATLAQHLYTTDRDIGSPSTPIYLSKGLPMPCTNASPTFFRGETIASSATNSIAIPTEITNNLTEYFMLQVYQNGLLLTLTTNYILNADNTAIILADYNCAAGDIFTFTLITRGLAGLDASNYITKASANASYLPLTGGTMRGSIAMGGNNITGGGSITANKVYGAVWNDYAEYRIADTTESGAVVCENGDDTMSISKERMQPAAAIVSDTFGFAIGETNEAKTPIAVSGRVLAKPYEPIEEFKKAIGRPVCTGPNGTVSIMTDEEYATKGYCSIGTISAVPDYEVWGEGVKVNGRVWIKVK